MILIRVWKSFYLWCSRRHLNRAALILFCIGLGILTMLILTPLSLPSKTVPELEGTPFSADFSRTMNDIPFPHQIAYRYGDLTCHQYSWRSIRLNGNQVPVCARDVGIYFGFVAGAGILTLFRISFTKKRLILGFLPMLIDGGLQVLKPLTHYESTNPMRILTGFIAGLAIALVAVHVATIILADREARKRQEHYIFVFNADDGDQRRNIIRKG